MIFPNLALTWYFHKTTCKECAQAYKKYGLNWIRRSNLREWHIWGYITK